MVDKRTLEKYEKEAKEKNRETWYLSWALDTNTEVCKLEFCFISHQKVCWICYLVNIDVN